jgi:hypothetical protein
MPRYFAQISHRGPVKYGSVPRAIGVLAGLDQAMPIGEASCRVCDEHGPAVWSLRIEDQPLAGRWIIIDREFKTAQ